MAKHGRQGEGGGNTAIVLTDDQILQVSGLASLLSLEQMADYFGICRKTFLEIRKRQPEVDTQYNLGKAKGIGVVAKGLLQQAQEGNVQAAIFYLKTQAGWKDTTAVTIANPEGETFKTEDTGAGAAKLLALVENIAERRGTTG